MTTVEFIIGKTKKYDISEVFNSVYQFFVCVGPDHAEQISTAEEQSDRLMDCCEKSDRGFKTIN